MQALLRGAGVPDGVDAGGADAACRVLAAALADDEAAKSRPPVPPQAVHTDAMTDGCVAAMIDVASHGALRAQAAHLEEQLFKRRTEHLATSQTATLLDKLRDEQAAQMQEMLTGGAGKEAVSLLVEAQDYQLRNAQRDVDQGLRNLEQKQRLDYVTAIRSLSALGATAEPAAAAGSKQAREEGAQQGWGVSRMVRQVGATIAAAAHTTASAPDPQRQATPPPDTVAPLQAVPPAVLLSLSATAPQSAADAPARPIVVEQPVTLLSPEAAEGFGWPEQASSEERVVARAENLARLIRDELTVWILPVSAAEVSRSCAAAGGAWAAAVGQVCSSLAPPPFKAAAEASTDLIFGRWEDAVAAAAQDLGRESSCVPGTVFVTRHSNMPGCHVALWVLHALPSSDGLSEAAERIAAVSPSAQRLCIDLSRLAVSGAGSMIREILKARCHYGLAASPAFSQSSHAGAVTAQTYLAVLHTAGALREGLASPLLRPVGGSAQEVAVALSAAALSAACSRDGPFTGLSPVPLPIEARPRSPQGPHSPIPG
eukprot:TRINITY_DN25063_c0_g1_i1.p1 TRINITY_DN25063_c0_g1~~TRINITY_DN25063_c0_g1_i1.p1  ORF type:complete len:542 (+),score=170.77 TRINITY_DN25063_c0_g1_i1:78-1703(+)